MATKTVASEAGECFYCSLPIEKGDLIYEEGESIAHLECYERERADSPSEFSDLIEDEDEDEDEDIIVALEEEPESEDPDTAEESEQDTEGPDGGEDE